MAVYSMKKESYIYSKYTSIIVPSPLDDLEITSETSLFQDGEIGDLGEEDEPGDGIVILFPTPEEKLLLLLPLLRLSSLEFRSRERLTNGPFVLKYATGPF